MKIKFVEQNKFGVLDHFVIPRRGLEILNPMRVVPNGSGSEVMFTLFQLPDMPDEKFVTDAGWVERDLMMLKKVLEAETAVIRWQENLIDDPEGIRQLLADVRRIAVLGIKTEAQAFKPAFYVPQYLAQAGFEVIPVPVYYPDVTEILGRRVFRKLADIPEEIDLVDVFRRSEHIPLHVEDMVSSRPKAVWFQLGIRNDEVAQALAEAGIKVVQDRCLMVEHRGIAGGW